MRSRMPGSIQHATWLVLGNYRVTMMQAAPFGSRDDCAEFRRLNGPSVGGLLVERKVSTRAVVVREVARQDAAQVPLVKDQEC